MEQNAYTIPKSGDTINTLLNKVTANETAIATEKTRAQGAETTLSKGILTEAQKNVIVQYPPLVRVDSSMDDEAICKRIAEAIAKLKSQDFAFIAYFDDSEWDNEIFGCQETLLGTITKHSNEYFAFQITCYHGRAHHVCTYANGKWTLTRYVKEFQ